MPVGLATSRLNGRQTSVGGLSSDNPLLEYSRPFCEFHFSLAQKLNLQATTFLQLVTSSLFSQFAIMSTADSSAQPVPAWDEAQCTSSLAHLEQLQAQVRRTTRLTISIAHKT